MTVYFSETGEVWYQGDTFVIKMTRYSDPHRLNLARSAAVYLGKKDRDNIRRPLTIIRKGHVPAIFRGEMVEFEFIDVSKEVYDHLITYTTANMRAAGGNRALTSDDYALPSDKVKSIENIEIAIKGSMANYQYLLNSGETPQVSRSAMPVAAKLNPFVFQFNFLTLGESIFRQRIWEKGAQGNTVKVIKGMYELCSAMDKQLWDTFYEYRGTPILEWTQVRNKIKREKLTIEKFIEELNNLENKDVTLHDYLIERSGQLENMW